MITLTTPITFPSINRIQLSRPFSGFTDSLSDEARVTARVLRSDGSVVAVFTIEVRDDAYCRGLQFSPDTGKPVVMTRTDIPTALTDCKAALAAAGGGFAAKLAALEAWLVSVGLVPAGTSS